MLIHYSIIYAVNSRGFKNNAVLFVSIGLFPFIMVKLLFEIPGEGVKRMKKIKMFVMTGCPHCTNARRFMEELFEENSEYRKLDIEVINETDEPELANQHDYYYVPTYYLDGVKFHEGVPKKKMVEELFKSAIK